MNKTTKFLIIFGSSALIVLLFFWNKIIAPVTFAENVGKVIAFLFFTLLFSGIIYIILLPFRFIKKTNSKIEINQINTDTNNKQTTKGIILSFFVALASFWLSYSMSPFIFGFIYSFAPNLCVNLGYLNVVLVFSEFIFLCLNTIFILVSTNKSFRKGMTYGYICGVIPIILRCLLLVLVFSFWHGDQTLNNVQKVII